MSQGLTPSRTSGGGKAAALWPGHSYLLLCILCSSPPRCWPWQGVKDQTESGTGESPLSRKMWGCNYSSIIIIFFTLSKRSVSGCWSIWAVGECFCCPSGRARLSWNFQNPNCTLPGKAVAVEWEMRPTMVLRKSTLGKSSFSLLQELPHTGEAEAGSQIVKQMKREKWREKTRNARKGERG